jgi:hypothetical protein
VLGCESFGLPAIRKTIRKLTPMHRCSQAQTEPISNELGCCPTRCARTCGGPQAADADQLALVVCEASVPSVLRALIPALRRYPGPGAAVEVCQFQEWPAGYRSVVHRRKSEIAGRLSTRRGLCSEAGLSFLRVKVPPADRHAETLDVKKSLTARKLVGSVQGGEQTGRPERMCELRKPRIVSSRETQAAPTLNGEPMPSRRARRVVARPHPRKTALGVQRRDHQRSRLGFRRRREAVAPN